MSDKYPLTERPWCRECSNPINVDGDVTTWYYAGDYGPLCSLACARPHEVSEPVLTKTGRVRRGIRGSNVRRIERTKMPRSER